MDWLEGTFPSKIEISDVTIYNGVRYYGGLPGKQIPSNEAVEFMKYIHFKNVYDWTGKEIPEPDKIN